MSIINAHTELLTRIAALKPKAIPTFPEPGDFIERGAHLSSIALAVDAYILAIGQDAKENMRSGFDLSLFVAPLTNAIEGNAIYELESCAEELANDR